MSKGYLKGFTDVIELFGIGQYAKDSWELFQNNNKLNFSYCFNLYTGFLEVVICIAN